MNNLILIGMSGAGKSTLGVLLAKARGMSFTDTDLLIQRQRGCLLQDIIDREGIDAFLRVEEEVLSRLDEQNTVVATGGSAVYSDAGMRHLRQGGTVVYLHVAYEEIARRLTDITTRGIVIRRGHSLRDAYDERLPLYRKYADLTVDCTGNAIEKSVASILAALRAQENK